jgi:hypothetical protein
MPFYKGKYKSRKGCENMSKNYYYMRKGVFGKKVIH